MYIGERLLDQKVKPLEEELQKLKQEQDTHEQELMHRQQEHEQKLANEADLQQIKLDAEKERAKRAVMSNGTT